MPFLAFFSPFLTHFASGKEPDDILILGVFRRFLIFWLLPISLFYIYNLAYFLAVRFDLCKFYIYENSALLLR